MNHQEYEDSLSIFVPRTMKERVQKHRRLMKEISGVPTARNAHAATLDKEQIHFLNISPETRAAIVSRTDEMVAKIDALVADRWGQPIKPLVRLDERKGRSVSRGGVYDSMWQTENKDIRIRYERKGGISIALKQHWNAESKPEDIDKPSQFGEYSNYSAYGDVGSTDCFPAFDLLLIHELSHTIQFSYHLHETHPGQPHGIEFLSYYSWLRRQLGYVDKTKPLFCELSTKEQQTVACHKGRPIPADLVELYNTDKAAYKNELARRRVTKMRAKKREEKLAAGVEIKRGRPPKAKADKPKTVAKKKATPAKKRVRQITKQKTAKRPSKKLDTKRRPVSRDTKKEEPLAKHHQYQPRKVVAFLRTLKWNKEYTYDVFSKAGLPRLADFGESWNGVVYKKQTGVDIVRYVFHFTDAAGHHPDDDLAKDGGMSLMIDGIAKHFRSKWWKGKVERSKNPKPVTGPRRRKRNV